MNTFNHQIQVVFVQGHFIKVQNVQQVYQYFAINWMNYMVDIMIQIS